MTNGYPVSEQERAGATVIQCQGQLRQAQEHARRAGEVLRRAHRVVEEAVGALGMATERLDRMGSLRTVAR